MSTSPAVDRLLTMGFKQKHGDTYEYETAAGYSITVKGDEANPENSSINYGPDITVHNKATSNLAKEENFVVLECVIRLLRIGYQPCFIELEKTWPLGHKGKGRLDVLLRDVTKQVFAMIECKTWGEEYAKERSKMLEDGGQLFSYFIQEKTTKGLYLYTSKVQGTSVEYRTEYVETTSLKGYNQEELFDSWDSTLVPNGLFRPSAVPYDSTAHILRKSDLKDLDQETGKGVFNSFAEILRRHVVSDKVNAFNKIFNLFVCKIADEDTKADDENLDFQWMPGDTSHKLLERLGSLYQHGLSAYLQIKTSDDFFVPLAEFAFVDVFDQRSYVKNASIVKEVVQLLQTHRIKYSSRHQFLGDFFEMLLNSGIKQEAGQFFTPVPLARFVLKSLPIGQIFDSKIRRKETHILPYVVDYACGSGHFLTEAMAELQTHIDAVDPGKLTGKAKTNFLADKNDYYWAKEYIYGVEQDYRLAKTTKVATFLNGDGDANIVNGNGLDDFHTSSTFKGRLKVESFSRDNGNFDVLISNPPYSISGFRNYLTSGAKSFSLYSRLTAQSSEIEALFVERAHQLLADGGVAGVILPLGLLNSGRTIYVQTRKFLLIHFDVVGLVELGDRTFAATDTTTACFFLRKRSGAELRQMLEGLRDYVLGTNITGQYGVWLSEIDPDGSLTGHCKAFFAKSPLPKDLVDIDDKVAYVLIYCLNVSKRTVIADSGEGVHQEAFLGYRFSTAKGKEGIHLIQENGVLASMLYNPSNPADATKVSTHIRANFLGQALDVVPEVSKRVQWIESNALIDGHKFVILNASGLLTAPQLDAESHSPVGDFIDGFECDVKTFQELEDDYGCKWILGAYYSKVAEVPHPTSVRILTASNIDVQTGEIVLDGKMRYLKQEFAPAEELKPLVDDVLISMASGSLKTLGKVAYVTESPDAYIGCYLCIIRCPDPRVAKVIYYNLLSLPFRKYITTRKDQNISNLSIPELFRFRFRFPKDLDAFFATCLEKENEFKAALATIRGMKAKTKAV